MSGFQDDSIINTLMEALADTLEVSLMGEADDTTKAGLVRTGKLQSDPTDFALNILVHEGGEEWFDELRAVTDADGFDAPPYEIGGNEWWYRRFQIELVLFFDGENERDLGRIPAMIVYSRAKKAITLMDMPQGSDSFGESVQLVQVRKSWMREGGGEGTFIWDGRIYVQFLTTIRKSIFA